MEWLKSLVRPVVTLTLAGAVIYFTAVKVIPADAFLVIATAAIVWWYKDRSAKEKV